MTEPTDAELVEQFQRGSDRAFNSLVSRYQEKIYWVARRFVNDHDRADDITQEVFCKAFESLKQFRGDSGLYTWLYRIAVNLSISALRKQRARDFFRIDDAGDLEADRDERPDEILELNERQRLIDEAIADLPEKQKKVFILRYFEELPYEEISAITGTSVGGLKANYFHAVKKIGEYVHRAHRSR